MPPKAITCPVILTGASTRVDGSLSLRLSTPELSSEEKTSFFDLVNKPVKILIQPDGEAVDVKEVKGEFDKKSPSQRLRSVLFVLWKQQEPGLDFDQFYLRHMDKLIDQHKQMLEPEMK